jgi:drug/metabolite transporter (DMT)-like permease
MMLIFKYLEKFEVNTFMAITVNYIVASILGLFISGQYFSISNFVSQAWAPNAIGIGATFITLFYLIAFTAQKLGVTVSTIANKMSVVIPVVFAFLLYNDTVTYLKVGGIFLALFGVYLASKKDEKIKISVQYAYLPFILFVSSGLLDAFVNYTEKTLLTEENTPYFIPSLFLVAGSIGTLVCIFNIFYNQWKLKINVLYWGIPLGILNYGSLYFLLKALKSENIESSVVYSLNNVGIVLLSALLSVLIFSEKLSNINKIGIALSVVAIFMISW